MNNIDKVLKGRKLTFGVEDGGMGTLQSPIGAVSLDTVLCTEELQRRPARARDYEAENRALLTLAQELAKSPASVLQRLVDVALELCRAHSAGVSLLEQGAPGDLSARGDHFRWHAVAGQWAPLVWNTTTRRDYGPCGTVLDRDATLLFSNAHRYYQQFASVLPLLVEGLLVPFHVDGQAVGTVWVIAHDESLTFDAEDRRLLESLATFAATAYQTRMLIAAQGKANNELQAEIAEREKAEAALREADRRKSEFLAMLAHELRNPLAPIHSAVEIVRQYGSHQKQVKLAVDIIQRQAGQLVRLVDDLMDVSRISRGKIEVRKRPIELASVIDHAVEAAWPVYQRAGHELTVTRSQEPIYLNADPARLTQVVGNLLSNAAKFMEKGGSVRLTIERDGGQAVVRVKDNGIGMAAEDLRRIFEMFVQVDSSLERSRDGLGIGLTLVKELVEMHGGSVEAFSAGSGHGSEFVVRLPVLSDSAIQDAAHENRESVR